MTRVESLALRCVMPGFEGTAVPDWVRRKAAAGLGAAALYARNVESREQLAALDSSLHRERPELLVAIDEEGGDVTRLEARTGSSYPGNYALGLAADVALTRGVAAAMGAELAAVGVDLDLAPVVDVNTNPTNPVIGVRSFGSDPAAAAAQAAAWIEGLQEAGVAACAKHFPGHGDTSVDSHLALPVVREDPRLRALLPFRAAISAGVRAVMSAHIVVPSLDDAPATISPRVMTGLLRDELGFAGLAISDGLEMQALGGDVAESAVLALAAGCDSLCVGGGLAGESTVDEIVLAVSAAVRDGRLEEERLVQAASRVDALAAWRLAQRRDLQATKGDGLVAARRAIRSEGAVRVGDEAAVIRLGGTASLAVGDVPWGMAEALAARGVRVTDDARSIVVVVRDLHRREEDAREVDAILARRPDAIVVEMGLPVCRPKNARAYVATGGASRVSAEAAAEVIHP
jgi:beta-N-acetylhexosaminidase